MQWRRYLTGLAFSLVFVVSYFTNKFVLSVLKFTYPTLFQGWQTFIGAVLLLVSGKLGWVEMSRITRSAALSWLPGSFLFVGNIYAGSRALSRLDIPFFFTLQNCSHVISYIIFKVIHRQQKTQWLKFISVCLVLFSAISLPLYDPQFDHSGYLWAVCHLSCVGAYRVFQVQYKSINLRKRRYCFCDFIAVILSSSALTTCSDSGIISAQLQAFLPLNNSVLLLAIAAHPTGDLPGALEFPSLQSHTFHCGCCVSALLGFLLLLATVKLKSGLSHEHFGVWIFFSKVTAMFLSPFIFSVSFNASSLLCVVISHVGEALLIYSERDSQV